MGGSIHALSLELTLIFHFIIQNIPPPLEIYFICIILNLKYHQVLRFKHWNLQGGCLPMWIKACPMQPKVWEHWVPALDSSLLLLFTIENPHIHFWKGRLALFHVPALLRALHRFRFEKDSHLEESV